MSDRRFRAAVIGSGFGGLGVAVRLQRMGFETTIFEARDKPGGRAYVYEDSGHIFDAGPTVVTAPHCFDELFEADGRKTSDYVELLPVSPFYRLLWSDGDWFDYVGESSVMEDQIRRRHPPDVEGYRRFVDYSRQVFEVGYSELVAHPFLHFADMVKVVPSLVRLRADRSVYSTVARFVKNDHIRQALSFHSLLVGGNPFETSAIYTLIHYLERHWGVYFPRGGTGALVNAICRLFKELGGNLCLSEPVRDIELLSRPGKPEHRVRTDRGVRHFDLVVSNADVHHTYSQLYRTHPHGSKTARKLERMDWSMSLFVLYFGTDIPYADRLVHHTVLFGPRYKGLLNDVFHGKRIPSDMSLYLHAPHLTDPTLAPPGCGTFYVLSPVPHLGNADVNWDSFADEYAERVLLTLERWMPNLRRHVRVKRWISPAHFQTELRSYLGSAFSCAPTLVQSAYFRPHNRDPEIAGLYLVGAGTHPGAGLPGVLNSAKATASVIAQDFGVRTV